MNKLERQKVFDKCGGKCAYCGCELTKGWHVDHVKPCRRLTRQQEAGYVYPNGKPVPKYEMRKITNEQVLIDSGIKWREGKYITIGFENPEANHIDNYLPSCPSCNINKHGDTIEGFRESIVGYLNSLNLRMIQYKMAKKYGLIEETGKQVVFYFELPNSLDTAHGSVATEVKSGNKKPAK